MSAVSFKRMLLALCVGVAAHWPMTAAACTACMGDVNSKTAPAINAAIFLMLGFIGFTLSALGGFAFYLMKRAQSPVPPHIELAEMMTPSEDSK